MEILRSSSVVIQTFDFCSGDIKINGSLISYLKLSLQDILLENVDSILSSHIIVVVVSSQSIISGHGLC